jgi:hypothetical protein
MPSVHPADDTNDYVPVTADLVLSGSPYLFAAEVAGRVTGVVNTNPWVFTLDVPCADGTSTTSIAVLPLTPDGSPPWIEKTLWRQTPKPVEGALFTAGDGSRWIYPANTDGMYLCYFAGSTHTVGQSLDRASIAGLAAA